LKDSILQKGVISPVLLRPDGKPGKYYLVCGERRYRASQLAGLETIPAFIRTLSEEEAFDLQITENLQRKDVHPMKEAQAYQALIDASPEKNTVQELARRFAKSEFYITQRLSFNNLIPEMKKDFFEGKMLIGHAVLFARLQPDDQKAAYKECRYTAAYYSQDLKGKYRDLSEVDEWIEDAVNHRLDTACFDKKSESLVPGAGSCIKCQKRSGGGLLFADLKDKDRCFDGKCYNAKKLAHTVEQIHKLVLTEPSMPVVKELGDAMDAGVSKLVKENNLQVLEEYKDYEEAPKKDKTSTLALVIAGMNMGKVIGIKFKKTAKAVTAKSASGTGDEMAITPEEIDQQITGIKDRLKRAAELDADKVHTQITGKLSDLKPYQEPSNIDLYPAEYHGLVWLAFQHAGYGVLNELKKLLKIKASTYSEENLALCKAIAGASNEIKNYIIRCALAHEFISTSKLPSLKSPGAWIMRKVAEEYGAAIDIDSMEQLQKQVRDKREESAAKRIEALQKKKKELKPANKTVSKKRKQEKALK
jgi:ParB/RepB/Spo0J family partition protein